MAVALDVTGVVSVGVVAPVARAGALVVLDDERGDPGLQVVAKGEVAAAQQPPGQTPNHCSIMLSQEACPGV